MLCLAELPPNQKAMDTVLSVKIVATLLYPLGLFLLLLIFSWLAKLLGWVRRARAAKWLAWLLLLAATNPLLARSLVQSLEQQHPQVKLQDIAPHDAIIVLGGGLRVPLPPAMSAQLASGSDRYWHAAKLYKAGKAKRIMLAGGNVYRQPGVHGEAFYAAELLQAWGVPANAIQIETNSRTTEQNRLNLAEWLQTYGAQRVLLVTSGYHMPRALEAFQDTPALITAAPADILIRDGYQPSIFNWLPSATALNLSTLAMHEYYGTWFARLKRQLWH